MLGEFFLTDMAHAVGFPLILQDINYVASTSFLVTVKITAHRIGLLRRFIGDFFRETEVEGAYRAGLHAEGLLILAKAVAAHRALAGFAGNIILGNHFPGTSMDAVFAADAGLLVDDHGTFFVFCNRLHRTYSGACGKVTVHATVARPKRRQPFEHRRLHGDPVGAR